MKYLTCTVCSGSGEGQYEGTRCWGCGGSGIERTDDGPDEPDTSKDDDLIPPSFTDTNPPF